MSSADQKASEGDTAKRNCCQYFVAVPAVNKFLWTCCANSNHFVGKVDRIDKLRQEVGTWGKPSSNFFNSMYILRHIKQASKNFANGDRNFQRLSF